MGNDVEDALRPLGGLRLRRIGHAAGLLWMHFGEWRETIGYRGDVRTVGEWALHVQCTWRFTRGACIVAATRDLFHYADTDKPYDWSTGGESLFDRLAAALNGELEAAAHHVRSVAGDPFDGFRLTFDLELGFELFPNAATSAPRHEFWRMFRPDTEDRHIVFGTVGPRAT